MPQLLHFSFLPQRADWITRLESKLGESQRPRAHAILLNWANELGELAGAIATRRRIVDLATERVNTSLRTLRKQLKSERATAEAALASGYAFRLEDGLAYTLVADIDSFLFETKAAYELVADFAGVLLRELGSKKATANRKMRYALLASEIRARGGGTEWLDSLKAGRDIFIHETAAWPALEVFSLQPFHAQLLLLKRNIVSMEDEAAYFRFDLVREIYEGFRAALEPLEAFLTNEIQSL